MTAAADIATPDAVAPDGAQALGELAALGVTLARDAATRAQAAETGVEAAALFMAFERLARSARFTFALRDRMARSPRPSRLSP